MGASALVPSHAVVEPRDLARVRAALAGVGTTVFGAAPHVLHHVGPLAGAAVLAGATGKVLFGALGFLLAIPMLRRLRRRAGSWRVPGGAFALMALVFAFSSFVMGPALTGGDEPAAPANVPSAPAGVSADDTRRAIPRRVSMQPVPAQPRDLTAESGVSASGVLTVDAVAKAFGHGPPWHRRRVEVLRGASLQVRRGELVGLVGENGSGKSVLTQVIVGLLARDGGAVSRPEPLGYCPQQPLLEDKLTVAEHFELFTQAYGLDVEQAVDSRDGCSPNSASASTSTTASRSSRAAPGRSSTWPWRCCTSRSRCCSTSPTPALTGKPT